MKYVIEIIWPDDSVSYAFGAEGGTTLRYFNATECTAMDANIGATWWRNSSNIIKKASVVHSYHSMNGQVADLVTL